ncbi:TMV resistance protein N-like isoform X3 [Argentina anserina]|uniref:TMV resistance protein N-like isoform X3 n=1 Tax=Argentina anserina TaxID=57926 RepID=UPI0021762C1F|nr:TMV resistance protein N-like isoform X3 [Potentilla anserina]
MVLKKQIVSNPLRISVPSNSLWAFDVFLSCDLEDIFCFHLFDKLQSRGICTFQDDQECARNTRPLEIFGAIEDSRFAIVVLSQNYASSSRRLNELSKILECMKDRNRILPIFHDVNLFDVQKQKGTIEKAFDEHEEMFRDDLAKVEAWRDALTNVCNFAGWTSTDRNEAQVVEEIVEALWNKLHPTSTHTPVAFASINVIEDNRNGSGKHLMHSTDVAATSVEWNFLITNLGLEILSAAFDQASSPSKPQFALFGIAQCLCSITQYIYFSWHADSPVKLSLLPAIFLICLAGSRLQRNHNHS